MTLTELRYIVALARERHFGRAARACFVSQPTLSVAIRKLEDELGVALFERHANAVRVTPLGERIVDQAQRALDETAAIKEIAKQGRDPLHGPLRLGVIFTIAPYLLPRLIPEVRRRAPQMPLILRENYTASLAEGLKRGELDAVIVALPFHQAGVMVRPLYDEPFVVAVPRGHAWEKRRYLRGDDLEGQDMLLLCAGHCFRDQVLARFPALGPAAAAGEPARVLEGSSLETMRLMVASGAGITVMPCTATTGDLGKDPLVRYVPFARPAPDRRVALAWRSRYARPQAIAVLGEAMRACALPGISLLDLPAVSAAAGPERR